PLPAGRRINSCFVSIAWGNLADILVGKTHWHVEARLFALSAILRGLGAGHGGRTQVGESLLRRNRTNRSDRRLPVHRIVLRGQPAAAEARARAAALLLRPARRIRGNARRQKRRAPWSLVAALLAGGLSA